MSNDKSVIRVEGSVEENLPGTNFRVKLEDGRSILAYLSGKMRKYYIKIVPGDKVQIELTPYDPNRGRITRRL
jgi:translation initiation factor IF-1